MRRQGDDHVDVRAHPSDEVFHRVLSEVGEFALQNWSDHLLCRNNKLLLWVAEIVTHL